MPSFTGNSDHSIDAKGRLIVPSRLRPALDDDKVVLTRWLDDCIALWSAEGWDEIEARLREQGSSAPQPGRSCASVAASAYRDEIDKQGRITVPQHAPGARRDRAGTSIVTGALNHAEIWSPEKMGRAAAGRSKRAGSKSWPQS